MIELILQKELMLIKLMNQKNISFSCGPYLCDGCYNIMQKSIDTKNIAIVHVKKYAYRIYFLDMKKREAKKLMINSNLTNKIGIF